MTDKPHMTLPNGDKLYEGDYGRTRDGRKVGPFVFDASQVHYTWDDGSDEGWTALGEFSRLYKCSDDIIAKWTEPKRETVAICYRAPHGQWREIGTIDLIDGKPARDSVKIEVGDA